VGALLAASFGLAVAGAFVTTFQFNLLGLASEIVLDAEGAVRKYSLYSVGASVSGTGTGSGLGLMVLEFAFLLLALVLPLFLLGMMLLAWFLPLRPRTQDALVRACHYLDCWASLDVAALTLTIGAIEFRFLVRYLVHDSLLSRPCNFVKDFTHGECFDMEVGLKPGFVILLVAGAAMVIAPKLVHQAFLGATARNRSIPMGVARGVVKRR